MKIVLFLFILIAVSVHAQKSSVGCLDYIKQNCLKGINQELVVEGKVKKIIRNSENGIPFNYYTFFNSHVGSA